MIEQSKRVGAPLWVFGAVIAVAAAAILVGVSGPWEYAPFIIVCLGLFGWMTWQMLTRDHNDSKN